MIDQNVRCTLHCVLILFVLSLLSTSLSPAFCRNSQNPEHRQGKLFGAAVSASAPDYLNEVSAEGWYRWPSEKLPVKVFFQPGGDVQFFRASFPDTLRSCFDEWSAASQGKLAWREVSDPKAADIVVRWSSQVQEGPGGLEGGRTKTFSQLNTETNVGIIHRAEMVLLTRLPDRELADAEVRKAYLHEVGHAFGIAGHSSSRDDIMYFAVSEMGSTNLGVRDKATINRLYFDYRPLNSVAGNQSGKTKRDNS